MFQRRSQRTERIACSLSCPLIDVWAVGAMQDPAPCLPFPAQHSRLPANQRAELPPHTTYQKLEPSSHPPPAAAPKGLRACTRNEPCLAGLCRRHHAPPRGLLRLPAPVLHHAVPYYSFTTHLLYRQERSRRDRYRRSPSSPQPVSRAVRLPTPLHTTTNLTSSSRTATTTAPVCRNQPAASAPPAPNHSQHQAVRDSHPSRPVSFSLCCQQYRSLCLLNSPPPSRYIYLYLSAGREVTDLICQSLQASSFFRHCPTNPKAIPRHIDHELTPSFHQASTLPDPGSALPSSILTWPLASINLGPSSTCQAATRTPS